MTQSTPASPLPEERPHKPADDREEVYFQGSPQLRGEARSIIGWGLLAAALIAGGVFLFITPGMWPFAIACLVLAILALVIPVIFTKSVRYRISNYRIDYERGILSRRIDTLELWHVEDIRFSQTLMNRMMGIGNIEIISHDETTPKLMLRGLPNPRPLFETLKQRVIAVKRQRGVIKMDIG
jgi:membrane protein YdbS with pleckstrin-like domain